MPRARRLRWLLAGLIVAIGVAVPAQAKVEAVPGKHYGISKEHGPWMIMVASFRDIPEERYVVDSDGVEKIKNDRYRPGKKAQDAADELVLELRRWGCPAYSFRQKAAVGQVDTVDRVGRFERRVFRAQDERICVLAGNYPTIDDSVAQDTLKKIKKLNPKCLEEGAWHDKEKERGPLEGAFLTVNPMLSQAEFAARTHTADPLLKKLNRGFEHSLVDNPHPYSVVIASFYGKTLTTNEADADRKFKVTDALDSAGMDAWKMAKFLRMKDVEAWVYHDRYSSFVTVGGFDSPDDPRIAKLIQFFGPKQVTDPETGKSVMRYEYLDVPGPTPESPPQLRWVLDPQPRVIETPRL